MMLGEVTPGGYRERALPILIYAVIAVFIGGVDDRANTRVPGQEIQAKEV